MTRPQHCIHTGVERVLGRLLFAGVLLSTSLLIQEARAADANRFIVRLKAQNELHPFLRAFARNNALQTLTSKVNNENKNVTATALSNVNVMIAEGSKEDVEAALENDSSVAYIEEDKDIKLAEAANDAANPYRSPYLYKIGLNRTGSCSLSDCSGPSHTVTKPVGESSVLVAVIDTGINTTHPFLTPFMSVNDGEDLNHDGILQNSESNGIDDDHNGYVDDFYGASVVNGNGDVEDVYDHGSHVAGLVKVVRDQAIALGYNEAKNVQVLPIRFFYECGGGLCGTTSGAILALNYAMSRGAKVVNMSWGSEGAASYSQALYETLVDLYNHNIVLVGAAGNESADTESTPFFPASHSTTIPGFISVNSITVWYNSDRTFDQITLSSFSNYGRSTVDIAAPGSTYYGSGGMLSANGYYDPPYNTDLFVRKSGTSMASPVVAGIAGVVRAINPDLNAYEVKQLVLQTATVPTKIQSGNTVRVLGNKNRVDGYTNASLAFQGAGSASTSGFLPAASSSNFSTVANDGGAAGGCGAITGAGAAGGGNPFGGNSMGLFTALFFISKILRKLVVQFRRRMLIK